MTEAAINDARTRNVVQGTIETSAIGAEVAAAAAERIDIIGIVDRARQTVDKIIAVGTAAVGIAIVIETETEIETATETVTVIVITTVAVARVNMNATAETETTIHIVHETARSPRDAMATSEAVSEVAVAPNTKTRFRL